jgi:hypothetical protein
MLFSPPPADKAVHNKGLSIYFTTVYTKLRKLAGGGILIALQAKVS